MVFIWQLKRNQKSFWNWMKLLRAIAKEMNYSVGLIYKLISEQQEDKKRIKPSLY